MQKDGFTAFVGIDWACRKHDVCLSVAGSDTRLVLEHRPALIREWAEKLRQRFGGACIAVCLELTQHNVEAVVPPRRTCCRWP